MKWPVYAVQLLYLRLIELFKFKSRLISELSGSLWMQWYFHWFENPPCTYKKQDFAKIIQSVDDDHMKGTLYQFWNFKDNITSIYCIQKTSKRLNRLGPNFVCDFTWPQGRFMNDQNFKNLYLKVFYVCKILKLREQILWNPQTFFAFVLYCTKRRCSQIKPQLKVEIEYGP